jgi:hypothetical protein
MGSTICRSLIRSGQHDVGHSGSATGRGAFNLSFPISVGGEENLHQVKFHLFNNAM